MSKLAKIFNNSQTQTIDVVGVGIPNSLPVGEALKQLNIMHILCFTSKPRGASERQEQAEEDIDLI